MANSRRIQKRRAIGRLLRKIWDSLDSHIDWAVDSKQAKFHRKTIREYAAAIKDAAELYD